MERRRRRRHQLKTSNPQPINRAGRAWGRAEGLPNTMAAKASRISRGEERANRFAVIEDGVVRRCFMTAGFPTATG
jgi:hypothetical protein